ncbi:MAG: hypothetical protein HEP70_08245 [Rhodobiaceae bacterium]|nr:hypothetical protein [Rhodobiaceae bacterium]
MTDATSAIVLTHNIDFLFLQSVVRPRLRKSGHPKLTIFADASCASGSYRQQRLLLDELGRHYRVAQVDMGVGRRFHPKAIFLAGPTKAALAVGSGNLTHGGWSANYEIWASYESDDDGLPAISAFRDYLQTVVDMVPQSESLSEETFAAFDLATNPWVADLPEPEGLYGTPSDRPLLDTMVDLAGEGVQKVTVCAPYYDPDGVALAELAGRFSSPIKTLLQKNHVGLSDSAASALPQNAETLSVDVDPSRFIHAKLYGFHRTDSMMLFAGSANVSRAALMAGDGWGNAELIAAQTISSEQADELLSDIVVLDEAPDFPETPPSDEWEVLTNPLRILAASFSSGALEIAFKSDGEIARMFIEIDDGTREQCNDLTDTGRARLRLGKCPKSVRLCCSLIGGQEVSSEPSWVDNEDSLGISVPERRIAAKLAEAAEAGSFSASGMFEILQLLHQHLQQHVRPPTHSRSQEDDKASRPVQTYNVEDVFSDDFGRPRSDPTAQLPGGFRESDFLRAFSAYFSVGGPEDPEEDQPQSDGQPLTEDSQGDGHKPEEVGDDRVREELEQLQAQRRRSEEADRLRNKLLAALNNVISVMGAEEFVASRPPERLGADIAATALLLRKGLSDEILTEEDFADVTNRLWIVLFFGSKDQPSVFQRHREACSPEQWEAFEAAVSSPRLTAALTLWCFPDWGRDSTDAIRFKFSAMLLAGRLPWLVSGGTVEEIHGELRRLARAIPGSADFETLVVAWTHWTQAGIAFQEFERAVARWSAKELADLVTVKKACRGELLWQVGQFCVSDADYRREPKTKAVVHQLGKSAPLKILGSWLVPVTALVSDDGLLELERGPRQVIQNILAEVATDDLGW